MNQLLRAKSSQRVLPKPGFGLKELRKWKQEVIWDHLNGRRLGRMGCRARTRRCGITSGETEPFITGRIKQFSFGEEKENKFEGLQSIRVTSHSVFHSPPWILGTGFHSKCTAELPSDVTKIRC